MRRTRPPPVVATVKSTRRTRLPGLFPKRRRPRKARKRALPRGLRPFKSVDELTDVEGMGNSRSRAQSDNYTRQGSRIQIMRASALFDSDPIA
jgi:hypothetical protein